ncbi:toll/interleukin-1 receptor domain-containing protein [Curtobacterium flaccumfaciens]|uniref:toll/interleukin-1 receptor domain-containing protein n=1 Tax=Curtobacterium flaccumfaciens TaxID=2035 RepID=UPI003993622B
MADVFISWSGDKSKYVAGALYEYLPKVIQGLDVFFSDQDIPSGSTWLSEIQSHLNTAKYGIVCVTPDNTEAPWLYFEAGAISRQTGEPVSRVSPLAIDMSKETLPSPLQGYNAIDLNEDGFVKMVKSIHETIKSPAPWPTIEDAARYHWSLMEPKFKDMPSSATPAPAFDLQEAIIEIRGMLRDLAKSGNARRARESRAVDNVIRDWSDVQVADFRQDRQMTLTEMQKYLKDHGVGSTALETFFPEQPINTSEETAKRIPPEDEQGKFKF